MLNKNVKKKIKIKIKLIKKKKDNMVLEEHRTAWQHIVITVTGAKSSLHLFRN